MTSLPKVSVIIPVHNDGKYLHNALQSVFRQKYRNYEIIVVDDGSEDAETRQALKQINQPEVRVFFKKPEGVSAARNFAIAKADGAFILPLDADDLLGIGFLDQAVKVLTYHQEVKVVCGDIEMFGIRTGIKKLPEYSMEMLLGQNTMAVTSLFRKSDFLETDGFNVNMRAGFEDWDFWLSMLEGGGDVHKLDVVAVRYRIKKESRNFSLSHTQMKQLRKQIYENHKTLYAKHFFDPLNSFEYDLLVNSREYKLGRKLLKPLRALYSKLR